MPEQMVNERTGEMVFDDVVRAQTPRERMKGLLGTSRLPVGRAVVIEPARQVHTIGMKFSLDIVFCDRQMKVLDVLRAVRPMRVTKVRWRARSVIECAAGGAAKIQRGDHLQIQTSER